MPSDHRQHVRYLRTSDGVKLAWAESGQGPLLIKAANWLTHLGHDWDSPLWRHWIRFFSRHFRFVRYDERGCGMTDWTVGDLSFDRWVEDLEAVVEAVAPREPFVLLGISQGAATCVAYAAKHPERVSRLLVYGGYARGALRRNLVPGPPEREFMAIAELARTGWGKDNSAFRQVFTSRFVPGATEAQLTWFTDLCRKTTSPAIAGELLEMRARMDATPWLHLVEAPTLVLHANDDGVVPLDEGRLIASGIPTAQFCELTSPNHILLEDEPAWTRFQDTVVDFAGLDAAASHEDPAFASLSPRERQILAAVAEGLNNAEIAERISLSEKTVRNHLSHVFDKLGVWSRAQAIVFARDHGFTR
jgi:pimeloyl-ACP methyl ester carboxylesterase/DNA-binding CsgD family transcriptional regulator